MTIMCTLCSTEFPVLDGFNSQADKCASILHNGEIYCSYGSDLDGHVYTVKEDLGMWEGEICDHCILMLEQCGKIEFTHDYFSDLFT